MIFAILNVSVRFNIKFCVYEKCCTYILILLERIEQQKQLILHWLRIQTFVCVALSESRPPQTMAKFLEISFAGPKCLSVSDKGSFMVETLGHYNLGTQQPKKIHTNQKIHKTSKYIYSKKYILILYIFIYINIYIYTYIFIYWFLINFN